MPTETVAMHRALDHPGEAPDIFTTIPSGEVLAVTLRGSLWAIPSTSYTVQDPGLLEDVTTRFEADPKLEDAIVRPGTRTMYFRALKTGWARIRFERPAGTDARAPEDAETMTLAVLVSAQERIAPRSSFSDIGKMVEAVGNGLEGLSALQGLSFGSW